MYVVSCILIGLMFLLTLFLVLKQKKIQRRPVILTFQDGGKFQDMNHLFHFMEHVIMVMNELYSNGYSRFDVTGVWFPLLSSSVDWIGKHHQHNHHLLFRVFPNIQRVYIGPHDFLNSPVIIMSDRHNWCRGPYNKMILKGIQTFPTNEWSTIFHAFDSQQQKKVIVAYIDRQNTGRRLRSEDHEYIISFCRNCPYIDFYIYHMEEYDFSTQILLCSRVDILIGVHGNGLTHCMFMKPKSFVIELFVEKQSRYLFDYSFLAKTMNHTYLCLVHGHWMSPYSLHSSDDYSIHHIPYQPLTIDFPRVMSYCLSFFSSVPCTFT